MTNIRLQIVTYEWVENAWIPVVNHLFYGRTPEEAYGNMEAHKMSDSFFAASFAGSYNGIILQNSRVQVLS